MIWDSALDARRARCPSGWGGLTGRGGGGFNPSRDSEGAAGRPIVGRFRVSGWAVAACLRVSRGVTLRSMGAGLKLIRARRRREWSSPARVSLAWGGVARALGRRPWCAATRSWRFDKAAGWIKRRGRTPELGGGRWGGVGGTQARCASGTATSTRGSTATAGRAGTVKTCSISILELGGIQDCVRRGRGGGWGPCGAEGVKLRICVFFGGRRIE